MLQFLETLPEKIQTKIRENEMVERVKESLPDVMRMFYTTLIVVLFGMNIFFVKRLVDKIDSLESTVWQLRSDVAILQSQTTYWKKGEAK